MNFKAIQQASNQSDAITNLQDVDFYMNLATLIIYIVFLAALITVRKGRIDNSAKIICIGYPVGVMAQLYWRLNALEKDDVLESFLIVTHNFLVISPSYFVFEMESIRCITKASTLEYFKKTRRRLIIESIVIASLFMSFGTVAAFLNAFTQDKLGSDQPSYINKLYLFGAVLQTSFYIPAIYVFSVYLISLNYFVARKNKAVLERQFELSCKQKFFVVWSYMIGYLQLSTLFTRIFITVYTRYWLQPTIDTNTIIIRACEVWITVVDWVTPFSLLYLYKHIGASKMAEEKTGAKYAINNDNTGSLEVIKMLLQQDENEQAEQLQASKKSYQEVQVLDTYQTSLNAFISDSDQDSSKQNNKNKLFSKPRNSYMIYKTSEDINESQENYNDQQTQKVEEFMNFYVKNTQWKQFLFITMARDTEQTEYF